MANKKTEDTKTVTLYSKNGTKVTVSEKQAETLRGFTKVAPKST